MEPKVVVVTGASSGIGAELSRKLGSEGHSVVLAARHHERLKAVALHSGKDAHVVIADVTKRDDMEKIKEEALRRFGKIDVWVNNAGRGIGRAFMDLTEQDLDDMISVNVKSVFFGSQIAAHYFKAEGKGHIINVSSFLGRVPFANFRSAYSASKAMVNSLTANLRMDLRRTHPDIKVSLVMPGVVQTDFAKNALHGTPPPPPGAPPMNGQTPQEVAAIIYDLILHPIAEVYTNPSSAETAKAYYTDVSSFEDNMFKR